MLILLDGSSRTVLDAIILTKGELGVDMIIVAIPNTDRDRDMMPWCTPSYTVENPKADNFLSFIGNELIPHVQEKYRYNGQKTIRGTSLSGLFVMYAFLKKPELFDNYIGNCAGWFADMDTFFNQVADKSFVNKDRFIGKRLFVANSTTDPEDPKRECHYAMLGISKRIKFELGERVSFTYEDADHIPFPSFYDGLKYVLGEIK